MAIPTRNGERWIAGTLRSVLDQEVDMEVVVSDDASSDRTIEIAASLGDPRVRIARVDRPIGMAQNWNRALSLCHGEYVKLLMQDDELMPGALRIQRALLDRHPSAAFAFGTRILEGDPSAAAAAWIQRYANVHRDLPIEGELTSGSVVAAALSRRRLRRNAIGEPSVVLVRTSHLQRTGRFNPHLRQLTDLDLWIRLAADGDVAHDPRPVVRFRVHGASATVHNRRTGDAWLDRLWIVDGLAADARTRPLISWTHFVAAALAGGLEAGGAVVRGQRSIAATARDLRAFLAARRRRRATPS